MELDGPVKLLGHELCVDCGENVPKQIWYSCDHRCFDCFRLRPEFVAINDLTIAVGRSKVKIDGAPCKPKKKKPPRKPSDKAKVAARERARAYDKAARRLARLHPAEFDLLLADERQKLGLLPIAQQQRNYFVTALSTFDTPAAYRRPDAQRS